MSEPIFSVRDPRLLTAFAVIGLAFFAMSMGVELTRFELAEMAGGDEAPGSRLATWTHTPGIAVFARRHAVSELGEASDASERLAATAALLSRAPLNSGAWAMLAAMRFASGAPVEKGVSALSMSNLTGPNEGPIMAARAVLAIPLWRVLPLASRRWAVRDLVGGWAEVTEARHAVLRVTLGQQAAQTRAEIRVALSLAGDGAVPIAAALGLGAASRDPALGEVRRDAAPGSAETGGTR
ncbi:MAG: hypothetical protein ACREC0_01115 [Methylocella sp.]